MDLRVHCFAKNVFVCVNFKCFVFVLMSKFVVCESKMCLCECDCFVSEKDNTVNPFSSMSRVTLCNTFKEQKVLL